MELAKVEVDEEINARIENSISEDLKVQESKGTFRFAWNGSWRVMSREGGRIRELCRLYELWNLL